MVQSAVMDNSLALGASRLVFLLLLIYVKSPNYISAFFLVYLLLLAFTCPHTPPPPYPLLSIVSLKAFTDLLKERVVMGQKT